MKPFPIPVVALGPGAQSTEDDNLAIMPMPSDMAVFQSPRLPDEIDPAARDHAVALLLRLANDMDGWMQTGGAHPVLDLSTIAPATLALVNDALGQGEVSARVAGSPEVDIQETIFAGLWRVQVRHPGGELLADRLEACSMPQIVTERAGVFATRMLDGASTTQPAGLMNAPAVLAELIDAARAHHTGRPAHVVNLTLLPMTPEDLAWLGELLGIGPVAILSRGYGNCRITSTGLAHTWWVQYFNSTDTLILNTLEVTDLPEAALAARDDLADSIVRLREWTETLCEI